LERVNPKHMRGLKVLVIDDSKTIRRTAETLLSREGCDVYTAVDGFDALSKIADHHPDIIFVDIMMPRLDGYQTCALIKHTKSSAQRRSSCCPARTGSSTGPGGGLSGPSNT
jgi:CheY-like chemotaxis protein